MKTYKSKSGEIMAEITVKHIISKYELEAAVGDLLINGIVVKSAKVVMDRLKETISVYGACHYAYFWDTNDRDLLPACILISKKYFPEFYPDENNFYRLSK